ncbi:MAG: hypothetical protein AAB657_05100 [Patescibacteria group bacterium]
MKLLFKISWLWLLILTTTLLPIPSVAQFFKAMPVSTPVSTVEQKDTWFDEMLQNYQLSYIQQHTGNFNQAPITCSKSARYIPLAMTDFNRYLGLLLKRESGGEEKWAEKLNFAFKALDQFLEKGKVTDHPFRTYLQFVFTEQGKILRQNGLDTAEFNPDIPEYLALIENNQVEMFNNYPWLNRSPDYEAKIIIISPPNLFEENEDNDYLPNMLMDYQKKIINNQDQAARVIAKKIGNDYLETYCISTYLTNDDSAKNWLKSSIKWFELAGLKVDDINSRLRKASQFMEYDSTWPEDDYCIKTMCKRLQILYDYLGDEKNSLRMELLLKDVNISQNK